MIIRTSGRVIDYCHQFLTEMAEFLDGKLDQIDAEAAACDDPDAFGQFDRSEYVAGIGFVACQEYITAVTSRSGKRKKEVLQAGPTVGNHYIAELADAGANYWKHHHTWKNPPGGPERRNVELLQSAGVDPYKDYVAANLLARLQGDHLCRFTPVVQRLTTWRDEVLGYGQDSIVHR